jgi:hypothetical protein
MTFIPDPKIVNVGDRVKIDSDVKLIVGTFTAGHEFSVIGEGFRGFTLRDDEGREMHDCSMPFVSMTVVKRKG